MVEGCAQIIIITTIITVVIIAHEQNNFAWQENKPSHEICTLIL